MSSKSYYRSYDVIMNDIMRQTPDSIDKREGSLLYTLASAAALSLAELSADIDIIANDIFPDTAGGENLDDIVKIVGLERRAPTKAVVKVVSDVPLFVGDMLTSEKFDYKIISKEENYYTAECTVSGEEANGYIGEVIPKNDIAGSGDISVTNIISPAMGEEDDESLRERFFNRVKYPVCAGNLNYYREVLSEIGGIGGAKIIPVPNGGGTVKIVIMNEDFDVPSDELKAYVKNLLDPEPLSGQGYGLAPIGHKVEICGVERVDVSVGVRLKSEYGSGTDAFIRIANSAVPKLIKNLNAEWSKKNKIVLRDSFFEEYFDERGGVADVEVISINGEENRLMLEPDQIIGECVLYGVE